MKNFIKQMIMKFLRLIGFKTKRHIVVFESDDWGAIRIPDKQTLITFKHNFPDLSLNNYQSLDCLETDADIVNLSSTLSSFIDKNGNPACFTINYVTENPNFEKIKQNNLTEFVGELSTETYQKSLNSKNVISLLQNGESAKVFNIELHAKEHINSTQWLNCAKNIDYCKWAFEHYMIGVDSNKYNNLDVYNITNTNIKIEDNISTACNNFKNIFNKQPQSFVASCYISNKNVESALKRNNINFIQTMHTPSVCKRNAKLKPRLVFMGQRSKYNQIYTTRNVFFETSKDYLLNKTPEEAALKAFNEIKSIFKQKSPAVICSHRVNYVSSIDNENAKFGNEALSILLKLLTDNYNDIEFMSSTQLAHEIAKGKQNGNN